MDWETAASEPEVYQVTIAMLQDRETSPITRLNRLATIAAEVIGFRVVGVLPISQKGNDE